MDGHNRYEICHKHGIQFRTHEIQFASDTEVKIWIIKNQFGRRNLSDLDKIALAEKLRPMLEQQAKANLAAAGKTSKPSRKSGKVSNIRPVDTTKSLAATAGVGEDKYRQLKTVIAKGTPALQKAVKEKTLSANTAAKVAELPPAQQDEIASGVNKTEVREAAKAVIEQKRTVGESAEQVKLTFWLHGHDADEDRAIVNAAQAAGVEKEAYVRKLLSPEEEPEGMVMHPYTMTVTKTEKADLERRARKIGMSLNLYIHGLLSQYKGT